MCRRSCGPGERLNTLNSSADISFNQIPGAFISSKRTLPVKIQSEKG